MRFFKSKKEPVAIFAFGDVVRLQFNNSVKNDIHIRKYAGLKAVIRDGNVDKDTINVRFGDGETAYVKKADVTFAELDDAKPLKTPSFLIKPIYETPSMKPSDVELFNSVAAVYNQAVELQQSIRGHSESSGVAARYFNSLESIKKLIVSEELCDKGVSVLNHVHTQIETAVNNVDKNCDIDKDVLYEVMLMDRSFSI
ncbi:hypothetical protein N9043_00795 [bacterium]|nr:hypothetical protein [bacterium]